MQGHDILMSSANNEWETPPWLFAILNDIFKFSIDAASSDNNHLCPVWFTEQQNSLKLDWKQHLIDYKCETNTIYLNPPYGSGLKPFMKKVKEEYEKDCTIVCLTPARVDTKWFRIAWDNAKYFAFIYGRLKFELNKKQIGTATFPSAISIFTKEKWDLSSLSPIAKILLNPVIKENE